MPPTHDSQVLKQDVRWGEFRIEDVLQWQTQKEINPLHIKALSISNEKKHPFYGQATANNGIILHCELTENLLNNKSGKPTILIHSNNQNVVYLETPFYLKDGHGATSVLQSKFLNKLTALYIITSIKKAITKRFSYNAKATKIALKNTVILLPIIDDGSIDFAYMEAYVYCIENAYILDLETKRNLHLRAYFVSANLTTYELTNEDKAALSLRPPQGEFVLSNLFDSIKRGKRIKSLDRIKGKLPFVTAGINERGISSYIGNPEAEIFPSNSLTIDMFGTVFYRDYEYGADDHVAVLFSTSELYSKGVLLYIGMCIEKSIEGKFSYSRNFYASDAYDVVISLPILNNGTPDFGYMEAYIKAQSVKKIANVANEFNLKINAAKHIVQN